MLDHNAWHSMDLLFGNIVPMVTELEVRKVTLLTIVAICM